MEFDQRRRKSGEMKEDIKLQVCRLCLNLIEDETFDVLNDTKKEMVSILLPQMNININNSVLCVLCVENVEKLSSLKSEFLNYLSNSKTYKMERENQDKCSLCSSMNEELCSVGENIFLKEMLEKCFPELDATEETSVCETCLVSLQSLFNFITTCLEIEEKIATYLAKIGGDDGNKINLFSVLQSEEFRKDDHFTNSCSSLELNSIKKEDAHTEFHEINSMEDCKIDYTKDIKKEPFIGEDDIEIKCDEDEGEKKIYKCHLCSYQTFRKSDLTLRHMLRHKNPDEVQMFKCTKCSYQSKRKGDLNSHLATHKDLITVYRCYLCHYKTIYKSRLEEHVLKHKQPEKYKCEYCSFKASYKKSFMQHLKSHKRESKKKMHKCQLCPYETKRRADLLGKHMLTHRAPEEVIMYKCLHCDYQAKHKSSVNRHSLKHLKPEEVTSYKCPQCDFRTTLKRYLTVHQVTHKDPEEVVMFKCELCPYEAKHKAYLSKHKAIHKKAPKSFAYNCSLCSLKTNTKSYFQKHLKRHDAE